MTCGVLIVGETPVLVPVTGTINNGLRLLARDANSGSTYVGITSDVTTSMGNLLNQGEPGVVSPYTVPADHFNASRKVYLIGSTAGQVVDYSFD